MPEDHLAAPTPLEEHRRLAVFAGEWSGDEMVYPSRWNQGGPATSHVVARIDLNGFYLIQDTRQTRDGKESFATHGVFTYDREDRLYKLFWHDSLGYYPPSPASGGWTGKSLILVRGSLRGNARHVYEVLDDNSYSMKMQFSPEAGGGDDVLPGVYRRIHCPLDLPSRESSPNHVHPDRQEYKSHLPGLYRQERYLPLGGRHRLRHQDGRGHVARQRRLDSSRSAGVRHCRGSAREARRRCIRDLRAAAGGGGCDLRSDRCRNPADRLHHRGHSGARPGAGEALAVGGEIAADRAELPRR